jgi:serine/threonine-protein kinase
LGHPGLLSIRELLTVGSENLVVSEWLEGTSLAELIERGLVTDIRAALEIAGQLAGTLALLNQNGVAHGNLKPESVTVAPQSDGSRRAVIVDFGFDRLFLQEARSDSVVTTAEFHFVGTPAYMAPEQLMSLRAKDARTEVYALGILLFEMLTGELPFHADNVPDLMMAHVYAAPPLLSSRNKRIPAELSKMVAQMLAKQPADRPTMQSVAESVARLSASPLAVKPALSEWLRLPSYRIATVAVVVSVLVLGLLVTLLVGLRAGR